VSAGGSAGAGGVGGSTGAGGVGGSTGAGGVGGSTGAGGASGAGAIGGSGGGASVCSGKSGAPGLANRSVQVGGVTRTFERYIPATLDPNQPVSVVMAFHGFTMSGDIMRQLTNFSALADTENFVVVYPDGAGVDPWNVGTNVCGAGAFVSGTSDDIGFMKAMLDDIEAVQCIDRSRVFTTGFSMGGYFANHAGCTAPELTRAIAPHSGGTEGTPTAPIDDCVKGPKPVIILHGTGDLLIDPNCGKAARDMWAKHNGCDATTDSVAVKGGHCEYSRNCPANGKVVLCLFDNMPHGWAGAANTGPTGLYGGGTQYEDATTLIWNFFKSQ
jgi:polyhydroxybutyrate depolymerase